MFILDHCCHFRTNNHESCLVRIPKSSSQITTTIHFWTGNHENRWNTVSLLGFPAGLPCTSFKHARMARGMRTRLINTASRASVHAQRTWNSSREFGTSPIRTYGVCNWCVPRTGGEGLTPVLRFSLCFAWKPSGGRSFRSFVFQFNRWTIIASFQF